MRAQAAGAVVVSLGEFRRKREERDAIPSAPPGPPAVVWVPMAPAFLGPSWMYWSPYWPHR